jgi:hypothetical protein
MTVGLPVTTVIMLSYSGAEHIYKTQHTAGTMTVGLPVTTVIMLSHSGAEHISCTILAFTFTNFTQQPDEGTKT